MQAARQPGGSPRAGHWGFGRSSSDAHRLGRSDGGDGRLGRGLAFGDSGRGGGGRRRGGGDSGRGGGGRRGGRRSGGRGGGRGALGRRQTRERREQLLEAAARAHEQAPVDLPQVQAAAGGGVREGADAARGWGG